MPPANWSEWGLGTPFMNAFRAYDGLGKGGVREEDTEADDRPAASAQQNGAAPASATDTTSPDPACYHAGSVDDDTQQNQRKAFINLSSIISLGNEVLDTANALVTEKELDFVKATTAAHYFSEGAATLNKALSIQTLAFKP